MEKVICE